MQTKYNIGDTLWYYAVYTDYETVVLHECKVVGINVNEHGHTRYMCDVKGYHASQECSESKLGPDKDAAIRAAQEYCRSWISHIQETIDELEKQLS